jgi:hypothetical protein
MNSAEAFAQIMTVVQQAAAAHADYPLVFEIDNRSTVDKAAQTDPYLEIEIHEIPSPDGGQLDLSDNPIVEQWGQIWISAVCKEGAGSLAVRKLRDFVVPYFDMQYLNGVHCRAVTLARGKTINGLYKCPAIVNFYYHRTKF